LKNNNCCYIRWTLSLVQIRITSWKYTAHKYEYYKLEDDGIIMHNNRVFVPRFDELRKLMNEMHNVSYVWHGEYQNRITVVMSQYFMLGMKKGIVEYISICVWC